jgi:4-diphosphocytidyl-2-C-methyl-D-erythritol kinase
VSDLVTIKSPAKVNLFLKVGEKLPNGYHNIVTVMTAVTLYDEITLSFGGRGIEIETNDPNIPLDSSNTVYRAADALLKRAKGARGNIGVKAVIRKRIPVEAGLGGASSNAASVILALNERLNLGLSLNELLSIGAKIGADIPFFIFGSPALVTGIGDRVAPIEGIPKSWMVIVKPKGSVSTKHAYKKIDLLLTYDKKSIIIPKFNGTIKDLVGEMVNDFESVVELRPDGDGRRADAMDEDDIHLPDVGLIKDKLKGLGSLKAMLTGSGSSVFGIFKNREEAEKAFKEIRSNNDWTVFLVESLFYNGKR